MGNIPCFPTSHTRSLDDAEGAERPLQVPPEPAARTRFPTNHLVELVDRLRVGRRYARG
jgi:hypothetical protein